MNNQKIRDAMALLKAKAYIYIDGKRGTFWGDLKDEEKLGAWHTLISIKHNLQKTIDGFEAKHFPVIPKKRGRPSKKK